MNTELFTGRAESYDLGRPGYPAAVLDYIRSLVPPGAALAEVGAGTGKFSALLAGGAFALSAVEPNADMRARLAATLAPFENARVLCGSAEATGLEDGSVDAIVCAQALHWFDKDAFRAECLRIGKAGAPTIAVYNEMSGSGRGRQAAADFFDGPTFREFPNVMVFTRESWRRYMSSHSGDPLPADPNYAAHIAEADERFDRESEGGVLRFEFMTNVWHEAFRR
ncbi:MAG: class I SAM-dependent methyltransferase [Treponema sp.]|nr:class I SAM-dependent methyltransferase [Treponema sp.]